MTNFYLPTVTLPIEKGELLAKYFSRTSAVATHRILTASWFAPSGLERVIEPFRDVIGTFDDLVDHNTFLPLQLRTSTSEQAEAIIKHHRHRAVEGIMAPLGMNGRNGGRFQVIQSMCPECAQSDIAVCQTPFWNRANMVPGLLFCSKHKRPLEAGCPNCSTHKNHNLLAWPGSHCGCGLRPLAQVHEMSTAQQEHEIELHRVSTLLLDSKYMQALDREAIAKVLKTRSVELGLIKAETSRAQSIREFFAAHPMRPLLERVGVVSESGASAKHLAGKIVYPNPLQSSALLLAMFDNWNAVESAVNAIDKHDPTVAMLHREDGGKSRSTRTRNRYDARNRARLEKKYIQGYIEAQNAHPHLNHTALMLMAGSHATHVLNKIVLREAGVDVPLGQDAPKNLAEIDRRISCHVIDAAKRLQLDSSQPQLTKRRLLDGSGYYRHQRLKPRLTRTQEALDNHVESLSEWRQRTGLKGTAAPRNARAKSGHVPLANPSAIPLMELVSSDGAPAETNALVLEKS
ncbi:hypothetical protein AB4851_08250 [Burkholderia sp. 22PA0099]|uniref:hypothetical protein n=1 Tax=Burkholderia sp. 22PA0099 TaxID=3237372 RepID=UPI0039C4184A